MNEDFLDFMRCMNQFGVQFILVGGYAYMYNVQARFTADIDFWVCPTQENLARLQKATWEFMGLEFDVDEVLALLQTSRLGFRLAGVKPNLIEVLLRVSGIPDFDQAYAQAKVTQDSGVTFRVLHPHDQIRNKRSSNREKDKLDLHNLLKLYGEPDDKSQG